MATDFAKTSLGLVVLLDIELASGTLRYATEDAPFVGGNFYEGRLAGVQGITEELSTLLRPLQRQGTLTVVLDNIAADGTSGFFDSSIDGATDFRIYWTLILPLCKPVLITLAIITFMGTWNDFLWPLIVMTDDSMYTLPVAIANLSLEHVQDVELMMAGSVITIAPVLILFAAVQKYYISGIMAGGVKGE